MTTAFEQLQAPDRRAALAGMAEQLIPRGRQSQRLRDALDGLQIRVQVIWGHHDRIIPARHTLEAQPYAGVYLLPAVGHLPHSEAAALVAAVVDHQPRDSAGAV